MRLPNLEVLEWSRGLTDEVLEMLEQVRSLRYVDVAFCHQVSSSAVARFRATRPEQPQPDDARAEVLELLRARPK